MSLRRAIDEPMRAQAVLLETIVHANAECELGRRYGFASIASPADYAARVPVHRYADFQPAIERMLAGERDVLFAGEPIFFGRTSGTTSAPKHIPFSNRVRRSYRFFTGSMLASMEARHPGVLANGMVILGQYHEDVSPGGVTIGSASGFVRALFAEHPHVAAVPMAITEEPNHHVRYRELLRCALARPLRCLHAINPSTLLTLFRYAAAHGEELADGLGDRAPLLRAALSGGGFAPTVMWPELELLMSWQGGNTSHYLAELARMCPGVRQLATCSGSSEAALLVPLADDHTGGVPALLSTYVEYLPANAEPKPGAFVPLPELQLGRGYRMCVTNWRGMYRLLMDDVFYVEDKLGHTPLLRFSSRLATSSVTGEKVTEAQVLEAIARAQRAAGIDLVEFQVAPEWGTPPRYVVMIEQHAPAPAAALRSFAAAFESALCVNNIEYAAKRCSSRLGPPVVRRLSPGDLARRLQESQPERSDAQSKIPRLRSEVLERADAYDDDEIVAN
jgi:GH3 auxin-responsive promoter